MDYLPQDNFSFKGLVSSSQTSTEGGAQDPGLEYFSGAVGKNIWEIIQHSDFLQTLNILFDFVLIMSQRKLDIKN